jgi:hypothetical protein
MDELNRNRLEEFRQLRKEVKAFGGVFDRGDRRSEGSALRLFWNGDRENTFKADCPPPFQDRP